MTDKVGIFGAGVAVGFILVILILALRPIETSSEYRKGQVDALTGVIHYELVTHPDSTKTWEFIEIEEEE